MNLLGNWQKNGQKKQEQPSDLSEMEKDYSSSPNPDSQPSSSIRRSLKEITVAQFIECYCNNNLVVLVKSGVPTPAQLQDAWNSILYEYASAIKNDVNSILFNITKKMALLQADINDINIYVEILRVKYIPELAKLLQQRTLVNLTAGFDDKESYNKQINQAVAVGKRKADELDEARADYDRIVKTNSGENTSESDFEDLLVMLQQFMGFRINQRETYMNELVSMYNLFIKQNSKK